MLDIDLLFTKWLQTSDVNLSGLNKEVHDFKDFLKKEISDKSTDQFNDMNVLDMAKQIVFENKFENSSSRKYPPFHQAMKDVANAASSILSMEIEPRHICIIMVLLKLNRESANPKLDNIMDSISFLSVLTRIYEY